MRDVAGSMEVLDRLHSFRVRRGRDGWQPEVVAASIRLGSAVADLASLDTNGLSDVELVDLASSVERSQRQLDAARVALHAALHTRGVTVAESGHTTAAWLGAEHGLSRPEAGRRVRVARKLAHLPEVLRALAAGEVTFDHARVLADLLTPRVHEIVVALQGELLALAKGVRFEVWVQQVRDLIALADPDGGHDPSPERNRVSLGDGLDGELFASVCLVGDAAAVVRHALNSIADQFFHQYRRDAEATDGETTIPPRSRLLAEALTELCRRGLAANQPGRAPAADVTVVIEASEPATARTPDGVRLADDTTRLFMCDPVITALVVDRLGVPLDMGRSVRLATDAQRRAAAVRDGGCVFPLCDAPPSWVELHHVAEYERDHGRTDMDNLASLCRRHHGLTHRSGWTMTAAGDHWFTWTTPAGRTLHSQRHGRPRAGP